MSHFVVCPPGFAFLLLFLSTLLGQILTCRRSFNCSNKPTGAWAELSVGHESDLAKGTNHRERRRETLTAEGCGSAFSLLPFAPWWIFSFSCSLYCCWELRWLVKINLHAQRGKRTVVSLAGTALSCAERSGGFDLCVCVCSFGWSGYVIHHAVVRRTQQA